MQAEAEGGVMNENTYMVQSMEMGSLPTSNSMAVSVAPNMVAMQIQESIQAQQMAAQSVAQMVVATPGVHGSYIPPISSNDSMLMSHQTTIQEHQALPDDMGVLASHSESALVSVSSVPETTLDSQASPATTGYSQKPSDDMESAQCVITTDSESTKHLNDSYKTSTDNEVESSSIQEQIKVTNIQDDCLNAPDNNNCPYQVVEEISSDTKVENLPSQANTVSAPSTPASQ